MSFAQDLQEALQTDPIERVPLMIGQDVIVRVRGSSDVVARGTIEAIQKERSDVVGIVFVRDRSGADITVAVDLTMYDVWVVSEVP